MARGRGGERSGNRRRPGRHRGGRAGDPRSRPCAHRANGRRRPPRACRVRGDVRHAARIGPIVPRPSAGARRPAGGAVEAVPPSGAARTSRSVPRGGPPDHRRPRAVAARGPAAPGVALAGPEQHPAVRAWSSGEHPRHDRGDPGGGDRRRRGHDDRSRGDLPPAQPPDVRRSRRAGHLVGSADGGAGVRRGTVGARAGGLVRDARGLGGEPRSGTGRVALADRGAGGAVRSSRREAVARGLALREAWGDGRDDLRDAFDAANRDPERSLALEGIPPSVWCSPANRSTRCAPPQA